MMFHYVAKKWKWFYGRYAHSGVKVWRKLRNKYEFNKNLYYGKTKVRTEKRFYTKGSNNRWIWHLHNVFRRAKPIQIQPINPSLINQRKIYKTDIWIWFEISRIFLYIYICIICMYNDASKGQWAKGRAATPPGGPMGQGRANGPEGQTRANGDPMGTHAGPGGRPPRGPLDVAP